MITCPSCSRENAENFNFCLDCGYDLKSFREEQPAAEVKTVTGQLIDEAPSPSLQPQFEEPGAVNLSQEPVAAKEPIVAPEPVMAHEPAPATLVDPIHRETLAPQMVNQTFPCPSCQSPIPNGNKFCGSCGHKIQPAGSEKPAASTTMFMHASDMGALRKQRAKQCKLITIDQSGQEGMTFNLSSGDTICGRVNGIILFFDDPYVSPTHCLFNFTGEELLVEDQNSLNGVYLRINQETPLRNDVQLRIGRQLIKYNTHDQMENKIQRAEQDDAKIWGSPLPENFGYLSQVLEDGKIGTVRLLSGEKATLGREYGDILFPMDGFISGKHCAFYPKDNQCMIQDLGSSNGTYLQIKGKTSVQNGDFILIGNQMLRVEIF